jgi:hypothetical protein
MFQWKIENAPESGMGSAPPKTLRNFGGLRKFGDMASEKQLTESRPGSRSSSNTLPIQEAGSLRIRSTVEVRSGSLLRENFEVEFSK